MADELALRSSVALTKWMSRIQLPEIVCCPIGKLGGGESFEAVFAGQFFQRFHDGRVEERGRADEMPTLGDAHGSEMPGPFIHVLKDVPMNCLQMYDVE